MIVLGLLIPLTSHEVLSASRSLLSSTPAFLAPSTPDSWTQKPRSKLGTTTEFHLETVLDWPGPDKHCPANVTE
ncbi:hypothetical protein ARMSODRAFT_606201 [Armillaria solidipes]|uniref:Uncharacterized protein n=1 Tax=Armillaria solidipes TaxID=1076256 RepID=A0A2H3BF76_9AGAR|nr:hypothetical protein ARMSODRAFT_606201 [Armillaria solidipes]